MVPSAPVSSPVISAAPAAESFTAQQKEYLDGFFRAVAAGAKGPEPSPGSAPSSQRESAGWTAQQAWLAAGKRLSKEEQIKFEGNPLDCWDRIAELSARGELPRDADVFRLKFHGLFNVSPAQEAMMIRLRFPGGALTAAQLETVADCAERYGAGYADVTTRANLQIRGIHPRHMADLLSDLHDAGIVPRGAGADNLRNITGSPAAGLDPAELYDVLPLCRRLHHHILNHRELYGLPRKFNISFDGGGSIAALEETNDIGFRAVRVEAEHAGPEVPEGTWFRVALGGITGHRDFARDAGLLLAPEECVPVADAMVRAFIALGDRGNRNKARLKYVLDRIGIDGFVEEAEKRLAFPLRRFPAGRCRFPEPAGRLAHLGIHAQKQPGRCWIGMSAPAARLSVAQLRGVADLARRLGSRSIRLTVWQNLLLPDVPAQVAEDCAQRLRALGLSPDADPVIAGLVACTGAEGCKFGQAPTKKTALAIHERLARARAEGRLDLDQPVNIHLTGCPHSCAQHFIGDIGLLATTVERDGEIHGGFHVFAGGGFQDRARIAVPARREVPAEEVPAVVEEMLRAYLGRRADGESFTAFTARHTDAEIEEIFSEAAMMERVKSEE